MQTHVKQVKPSASQVDSRLFIRFLVAVGFGLILSGIFSLASGWVNPILFGSLPLDVDWRQVRGDFLLFGVILPILGVLCAAPGKFWGGAWLGAVTAGIVIAIFTVIQGEYKIPLAGPVTFMIILAPIIVMLLPLTMLLRWLLQQQVAVIYGEIMPVWLHQLKLLALLLVIAALPALTRVYTSMEQRALQGVHVVLQAEAPTTVRRMPEALLAARQEHAGQPYRLLAQRDPNASLGVHIQVTFADGDQMRCSTLVQPSYIFFDVCQPGGFER